MGNYRLSLVMTRGIYDLLKTEKDYKELADAIGRFNRFDWGDICKEDWAANDQTVVNDFYALGCYYIGEERIWIIQNLISETEVSQTVLLPSEY